MNQAGLDTGRLHNWAIILLCVLGLNISFPDSLPAQDNYCDPNLPRRAGDPYGYRLRNDRCEGTYIQKVAGMTGLQLVSFTGLYDDYDLDSGADLFINWPDLDSARVRLRAYGLKYRTYYRMDTEREPGDSLYRWPTNVLAVLNLTKKDIGVVGWIDSLVSGDTLKVYLPLRISQQQQPPRPDNYQLLLRPGVELREVYRSLARINDDGGYGEFLVDEEPLEDGPYPAGQVITIPVKEIGTSGIYRLELAAILSRGGSSTAELYFYHKGL